MTPTPGISLLDPNTRYLSTGPQYQVSLYWNHTPPTYPVFFHIFLRSAKLQAVKTFFYIMIAAILGNSSCLLYTSDAADE